MSYQQPTSTLDYVARGLAILQSSQLINSIVNTEGGKNNVPSWMLDAINSQLSRREAVPWVAYREPSGIDILPCAGREKRGDWPFGSSFQS